MYLRYPLDTKDGDVSPRENRKRVLILNILGFRNICESESQKSGSKSLIKDLDPDLEAMSLLIF